MLTLYEEEEVVVMEKGAMKVDDNKHFWQQRRRTDFEEDRGLRGAARCALPPSTLPYMESRQRGK